MAVLAILPLAGCSLGPTAKPAPAPTVATEGQGLKCSGGDHGIQEVQFGWSWCYPATWKFQERLQPTSQPKGVDATFDIVNDLPRGQVGSGDFGFLIVGTYQIGTAIDLAAWITANIGADEGLTAISWGNAKDAQQDGHVVVSHVPAGIRGRLAIGGAGRDLDHVWRARLRHFIIHVDR